MPKIRPKNPKKPISKMDKRKKYVYFFGGGKADGHGKMKDLLGGKGAGIAEMTRIGIPVPPGFTISTGVCRIYYENKKQIPDYIIKSIDENLVRLEKITGKKFGDSEDPLLVSVRSGSKFSMPGMMDTVLNLGIWRWMSARSASSILRGSATIRVAPRTWARLMAAPKTGCVSVVF